MKSMDFFAWQGAGRVNSESIHDDCNAARRKKTRFHGAFIGWDWYKAGIRKYIPNFRFWPKGGKWKAKSY
jgi:hypothetical protein